jgi:hypothetical protein
MTVTPMAGWLSVATVTLPVMESCACDTKAKNKNAIRIGMRMIITLNALNL